MQPVPFGDRNASIVTYELDRLAYTVQPPMVMAMLDFDGGGRVELEVTDNTVTIQVNKYPFGSDKKHESEATPPRLDGGTTGESKL